MLRSDGEPQLEERKREFRDKAAALGVPVYDEMSNGATRSRRCRHTSGTCIAARA